MNEKKTYLLFGVTGATGQHVLIQTLKRENSKIVCFARNPTKIPADIREKVQILQGDITDGSFVRDCVKTVKPDSIIVTTSIGTGNKLMPLNQTLVPDIVSALTEDGRLDHCKLIYLSGAFAPTPPDREYSCFFPCCMVLINLKANIYDNAAVHEYLYSTDPLLNFTVVKMAMVSEGVSKGKLKGLHCKTGVLGEGVKFTDVGDFLVMLATESKFEREFIMMAYE